MFSLGPNIACLTGKRLTLVRTQESVLPIVPSTGPNIGPGISPGGTTSVGHSGGPGKTAPSMPAAASEAAAGGATFGQILHAAQGQAPAASANAPTEQPAAVPLPREPLPGSPKQIIQPAKPRAHLKNERPAKKTASNSTGARNSDSTIPASFAPVAAAAPPPPPPPPAMAAAPAPPNATGALGAAREISPRTTEPPAGQTRNQPLLPADGAPADGTMVPDPAGMRSQPGSSGSLQLQSAGPGAQPTVHPPPLHALAGASFAAAANRADPKTAPGFDTPGSAASPNGPVAAVPLMASPPPLTSMIQSAPMIQSASVQAAAPVHQALPAAQVAPALAIVAKAPDGTQQMTVRLNPDQLGMVQIRLDRSPSGATHIQILADRPETLQALQRDQPALHKTLDEAGIPGAGRTMVFHDAPRAETQASSSGGPSQGGAAHNPSGRSPGNGQGGTSGGTQPDDRSGSRRGSYPARGTALTSDTRAGPGVAGAKAASTIIYRVGLNITA